MNEESKITYQNSPAWSMNWLINSKNSFNVLSEIMLRKNFKRNNHFDNIKDDEIIISFKDFISKPKKNTNQIKKAIDNLIDYGFIEIQDYKGVNFRSYLKRIKILVDIFDPSIATFVKDHHERHRGFAFDL